MDLRKQANGSSWPVAMTTTRAAIALFHFEDMSIAETAVALDVPAGTVKTRLMHARRTLRAVLEGDE